MLKTFQPTHPHGVRHSGYTLKADPEVSTHAPARGATSHINEQLSSSLFQPTHPHGVRQGYNVIQTHHISFQPTHPHGVRLLWTAS